MASIKGTVVRVGLAAAVGIAAPLVMYYEGVDVKPYKDPVGIWTVCYGETNNLDRNRVYTLSECRQMLGKRLDIVANDTANQIKVPVKPETMAAFISFAYNIGNANLGKSTALRKLNSGDTIGACNELTKWVYAKGQKLPGLVKRREAERQLCLRGTS